MPCASHHSVGCRWGVREEAGARKRTRVRLYWYSPGGRGRGQKRACTKMNRDELA